MAAVADGMLIVAPVAVKPAGPDHVYTGKEAGDEAVSVNVLPEQIVVAPVTVGGLGLVAHTCISL